MRPNAAERPVWASDPRYALIWQLKSYFYAFHKKITGGILREVGVRQDEARRGGGTGRDAIAPAVGMLALAAVALLPLAMMGMELREYAKAATAFATTFGQSDKDYFRSDTLSWSNYLSEVIEKTGIYGPMSILMMANKSNQWHGSLSGVASILGPTAESIEAIFVRGDTSRAFPLFLPVGGVPVPIPGGQAAIL